MVRRAAIAFNTGGHLYDPAGTQALLDAPLAWVSVLGGSALFVRTVGVLAPAMTGRLRRSRAAGTQRARRWWL